MKLLESFYCYIYQYEVDQNSGMNPRKTGTIITTVVILMWVVAHISHTYFYLTINYKI